MIDREICEACWERLNGSREPVRIVEEGLTLDLLELCCECGQPTSSGIYVRRPA